MRTLTFVLVFTVPALAQWLQLPTPGIPRMADGKPNLTAPAPRMQDGKPDLSGLWQPDLTPYQAVVPRVALNNLIVPPSSDRETARWIRESERQDFTAADLANPEIQNRILWFSVRGGTEPYPAVARLPAFDVMRTITAEEASEQFALHRQIKALLAMRATKSRISR